MTAPPLLNANPTVRETTTLLGMDSAGLLATSTRDTTHDHDETVVDVVDREEIYDLIRHINDPEHPLTLEALNVVREEHVWVDGATMTPTVNGGGDGAGVHGIGETTGDKALPYPRVRVEFTPTIPHCSMATLIGLSIRVKLLRSLPHNYKVDVRIREGTHQSEHAVNKQLNDKERVAAALENRNLLEVVNQCLTTSLR